LRGGKLRVLSIDVDWRGNMDPDDIYDLFDDESFPDFEALDILSEETRRRRPFTLFFGFY
jgi:hypothetical protein